MVRGRSVQPGGLNPLTSSFQGIPIFLPIMRGALTAPSTRDPEILERLDTAAFYGLCRRYQVHLHAAASLTAAHQEKVNAKIREVRLRTPLASPWSGLAVGKGPLRGLRRPDERDEISSLKRLKMHPFGSSFCAFWFRAKLYVRLG